MREIHPDQLFMLFQSLQPDRQRNFGYEEPFELSCEATDLPRKADLS